MNSSAPASTTLVTDIKTVPLLEISNLSLRHLSKSGSSKILDDVSVTLSRGEILGNHRRVGRRKINDWKRDPWAATS